MNEYDRSEKNVRDIEQAIKNKKIYYPYHRMSADIAFEYKDLQNNSLIKGISGLGNIVETLTKKPPPPPFGRLYSVSPPPELKRTFRITQLTKLLTFGYSRLNCESDKRVPDSIQLEIVKYVNLLLVRLNYNLHGDISDVWEQDMNEVVDHENNMDILPVISFDSNADLCSLSKFMEKNGPMKYLDRWSVSYHTSWFVRIWMKFKNIYGNVTKGDILPMEEDPNRWVEIPDDYMKDIFVCNLDDDVDDDEPLEIGVEFYDQINNMWPSRAKVDAPLDATKNERDWTRSLKVGHIIDVNKPNRRSQHKWYEAVIRNIAGPENDRKLAVHFIGWPTKFDEKISAMDSSRIQKRGTFTKGPCREPRVKIQHRSNR